MAGSGKYVLTLEVDTKGTIPNIDEVKNKIQQTTVGMSALQKVQGPIFGVLNQLTGGLAGNLKDVYQSVGGVTKGFGALKGAIIATGIGALVILVTELVTNFDKYKDTLLGVGRAQKEAVRQAQMAFDIENKKLEVLGASDNILKLSGKTEKEIFEIKKKQFEVTIEALRASILQEQSLERQRKTGLGLVEMTMRRKGEFGGWVANLMFGKPGELDEGQQKLVDMKDQLLGMENSLAGLVINEEARVTVATNKIIDNFKKIRDARIADTPEMIKVIDEQLLALETAGEKELAIRKHYSALGASVEGKAAEDSLILAQRVADGKAAVAQASMNLIGNISEMLMKSQGKRARRDFAIGKALGIAQATINTYKGAAQALGTYVYPYSLIMAGLAVASGLFQVRQIAKQRFNESGGGSGSGGSGGGGGGGGAMGGGGDKSATAPAIDFSFLNLKSGKEPVVQAYMVPGQVSGPMEARQKIKDQSRL